MNSNQEVFYEIPAWSPPVGICSTVLAIHMGVFESFPTEMSLLNDKREENASW